jgi:hypothetical protein
VSTEYSDRGFISTQTTHFEQKQLKPFRVFSPFLKKFFIFPIKNAFYTFFPQKPAFFHYALVGG